MKTDRENDSLRPALAPRTYHGGGATVVAGVLPGARTRRARLRLCLLLLIMPALSLLPLSRRLLPSAESYASAPAPQTQELRKRKNILEVESAPEELKNLRHAFFMLKKKAKTCDDPEASNDYDCWAAYHNNFELYGCRHRVDLFWPWHRYHLVEFEKALRGSDPAHPERVRDVTLPYWDWTMAPSGKNFPKSVEQEDLQEGEYYPEDCPDPAQKCKNPLWMEARRANEECQLVKQACVSDALGLDKWRDFGGGTTVGQISDFELQAHNFMHASYIQGPMANPRTAAQDPIYWFFHAYIDNVWDRWQKLHETDPCNTANVPNAQRRLQIGEWPPSSATFETVICTKKLNYEYAPFGPPVAAALPNCPQAGSGCNPGAPETLVTLSAALPSGGIEKAELSLSGVSVPAEFSYEARILLHPSNVKYRPGDKEFAEKYAANYFVAWKHGHHTHAPAGADAHDPTMDVQLDVTNRLREMVRARGVRGFVATIVFSPSNNVEKNGPLVFGKDISFVKARLVLKRAGSLKRLPLTMRR